MPARILFDKHWLWQVELRLCSVPTEIVLFLEQVAYHVNSSYNLCGVSVFLVPVMSDSYFLCSS